MVLSKKIIKQEGGVNIDALILKGGTSGAEEIEHGTEKIQNVQLRISSNKLKEIDVLVKARPGNLARHTWIMEAIEEKLRKDRNKEEY